MRPSFFLMENVRGLLSAGIKHRPIAKRSESPLTAEEQPGTVAGMLLKDYESLGYRVDVYEVNAVNYGAPQLRERVLFIGNKYGLETEFPKPTHSQADKVARMSKQKTLFGDFTNKSFRTLGEALAGLDDPNPEVLDFSPRKKKFLSLIPEGGNWRALPEGLRKESMGKAFSAKGGRSGWWRRLSFDLPCPCLLTMPNHASTALCHPTEVRALSVKEYARIQEFPDMWQFVGDTAEKYRQIGNAVPVRLGQVAAKVLADGLMAVGECGLSPVEPGGTVKKSRISYVMSHVRTKRWYQNGEAVIGGNGY
jgi:DNA (cytosine-5)-methyltransferase 1